jgi:5'-nucleotidase
MSLVLRAPVVLILALLLAACQSAPQRAATEDESFSLRILHINDHHSRLAPDSGRSLVLDGRTVQVSFGGYPQLASAIAHYAAGAKHVLKLHAGDAITGDFYYTLFKGEADADLMNQICFDAFVVGNHEFDFGDIGVQRFLDYLSKRTWDCDTPALGANVVPAAFVSPLGRFGRHDYLLPSVVIERGGRRFGIAGITVAGKTMTASNPDPGTILTDEAEAAQATVDALRRQGVDSVILLTHVGYRRDLDLARRVRGVDLIIGGDSHSLLGTEFEAFGLSPEGPYPTRVEGPDGRLVCVVQAWQYTWALGVLDVAFDSQGRVRDCKGQSVLLLGDDLRENDQPLTGPALAAVKAAIDSSPNLQQFPPDPATQRILDVYRDKLRELVGAQLATVPQRLCLRRVPGQHDRSRDGAPGCAAATDAGGGHAQAIVAEAFLAQGQRFGGADIALQNGGGVRNGIAQGAFAASDAYLVLPFKNTLVRLELTGAELLATLEDAIDYFLSNPATNSGAYPYAAGLRWRLDLTRRRGDGRFSAVEVLNGQHWEPLDPARRYRVITNDYIASGRDGYASLALVDGDRRENTFLEYAEALIDYAREVGELRIPPPERRSTQWFRDLDGCEYQ